MQVERWLEQLGLEERGSKGGGSEVWQKVGLREVGRNWEEEGSEEEIQE